MVRVTGVSAKAMTLALAGMLLLSAGCKKDEETAVTDTPAPPPLPSASAATVGANAGDVASYPSMTPQRGTRRLLQPFVAYQAADAKSAEVARIEPGTVVTFKANYGAWMMVSWPKADGQLSLGWLELKVNDTRAAVVAEGTIVDAGAASTDAGTRTDAGAAADAGTAAAADAGTAAPADAGATVTDAGATPTDAGAKPTDAGAKPADAGASLDGGTIRKKIPPLK